MDQNDLYFYNTQGQVVKLGYQWNSPSEQAPEPPLNAGLYTGKPFSGPWGNYNIDGTISVPTEAYLKLKALKSANPPPGVEKQLESNRPGNNFVAARTGFAKYA